jgi:hypothetical protein
MSVRCSLFNPTEEPAMKIRTKVRAGRDCGGGSTEQAWI